MKYPTIILLLFLASCHPGKKLSRIYNIEESKGSIIEIRTEVDEYQSKGIIEGLIIEQSSKEKIFGATVILHNRDTVLGTVSDVHGSFQIRNIPDDCYHFIVSMLGYHSYDDTMTISENERRILNVELIVSPVELGSNKQTTANTE